MKRISILFILLGGLLTPFAVEAMAELGEMAATAAKEGLEGLGAVAKDMAEAGEKALTSVAERGDEATAAVTKLVEDEASALKSIEGGFKDGKIDAAQADAAWTAIGREAEEEAGAITKLAGETDITAGDALVERIGRASDRVTVAGNKALKDAGVSDGTIADINAAAKESSQTIAGGGGKLKPAESPQPTPHGVASDQVAAVTKAVDKLGQDTEALEAKLGGKGAKSTAKSVEDGDVTGLDNVGEGNLDSLLGEDKGNVEDAEKGDEYAAEPKEPSAFSKWWAATKDHNAGRLKDIDRLSGEIKDKSAKLDSLEADVAKDRVIIKDPEKNLITGEETPGSVQIQSSEFKVGSKNAGQVRAINNAFKNRPDNEIKLNNDNVTMSVGIEKNLITEDQEVLTVTVKIKGKGPKKGVPGPAEPDQFLTFRLERPSDLEKEILQSGRGSFILSKEGRLSFKSDDDLLGVAASDAKKAQLEEIQTLKSEITQLKVRRSERENLLNSSWRVTKSAASSIKSGFKEIVNNPKAIVSAAGRGTWRGIKTTWETTKTGGSKVINGTLEILKMMMTGVFFGVPSMIYQTLMQQAAAKALYEQITAVYHITPNFAVQIPASLISPGNAAQAGTYLYVAVDPSTSGFGNKMSSAALQNGSYYVVYQSGAQWGSTYATSQNAFGVWVSLGTGLIFMDGGVPYSDQTPFAYLMEPTNDSTLQAAKGAQTTLSVMQYTQQAFDAVGNRANYLYSEGILDSIAPWKIATESYDQSVSPNSILQQLFAQVESTVTHGKEKVEKPSRYAPKVLVRTLNIFRNGIQNVAGFLPGPQSAVPKISIRQFEGTGVLNRLLGSQVSANNIEQSIQLITTLSATTSPTPAPALTASPSSSKSSSTPVSTSPANVIQAVIDAQAAVKKALSDVTSSGYGNEVEAASAALKTARTNLQSAIATTGAGTNMGMDSSIDVNAYNIYLYETEDTPIVQFMKQNRFSDLIPVKDYVIFLDGNLNIAPLFSTAVITRPDGVAVVDFDTSQINSNIQYMVSLVTGLIYQYSATGAGTLVTTLNNMPASQFAASTVIPALFQQIALVLSSADANALINQIISMANYATNLSYQGPIVKNGCLFEKIPLETSSEVSAENKAAALASALNGITIPAQGASTNRTSFGPAVPAQPQSTLDTICLYKVSKIIPGSKEQAGVFGTSVATNSPIYDYVLPVAQVSLPDSTSATGVSTYFQIMPLGIADAAGNTAGVSGVQLMVSLVTGQVYDNNYCLLSPANVADTVIERNADFSPVAAQAWQSSTPYVQTNADGTTSTIPIAVVHNLPLATAFMPTFCNPYNITYGSLQTNPQYEADSAGVTALQTQARQALNTIDADLSNAASPQNAREIWNLLYKAYTEGGVPGAQTFYDNVSKGYASWFMLSGEPPVQAGKPGKMLTDIQTWLTACAALVSAQQALQQKVQSLQSVLQPPYAPVAKATDQMLIMCPMYWMHYVKFAWAPQAAAAQTITYTTASQQQSTANINWINTTVSSFATPLGCSFAQALPLANATDIINAYEGWQEVMNSTNGVAKIMQSGPFQFSHNEKYNVYLTLPPSNGPLDLETGNFFYSMVPVAFPTSLFVVGDLDPDIVQSVRINLNKNATAGLTAPLTIDQCNTSNRLGHSYLQMLQENPVAIDISTGDVWFPTPLGYSATCYNLTQGNIANAACNIFKLGTLNPEKVLEVALKNQGTTLSQLQVDNPGLYALLMNAQALGVEKAQLALSPFYFAGSLLSLCQEEIDNKTYIYAVGVTPDQYYEASDYWVATDVSGNPQGILTPQTQFMVSLVTGNVYQMNYSSVQQTTAVTHQDFTAGSGVATIDTPLTVFQTMFGVGPHALSSTMLTPVGSNNPKLFNRIESLNNVQNQEFLQSQLAPSANTSILAGQIPLAALQTASPVSPLYSTLYLVNGKYYLSLPGSNGTPSYYYDFNAELQDVVPSQTGGAPTYTPIAADAQRGMYYLVEGTGANAVATPVSALTGYGCQAMRMRFGIKVDAQGNETMGLPVYNPPLPMSVNDAALKPGESGETMKCLTSSANIAANSAITDTYTYYQYKNIASESYLTRCYLNTQIPVYNPTTQGATTLSNYQDYYVDLVTGECYSPDGTPKLSTITVGYNFSGNASTGIVANTALDFSNPLFVWGELDLLGDSLQACMMYQDTNADPSSGYNFYQVQPYSTSFTIYNGKTPTVYAYGTSATGAIQITENGTPMNPVQTSMSTVLVNALNGGGSLATKSYTMNINGVVPSGTPVAGATVTVTETYASPKQYMISYTDAAGTLINDMFQVPVTSGTGTAPGGSTNSYNNPPLDATLQAQLLQGKPFCARVFASCPYGQETVSNINTTNLGTTAVTCGLLYQPATAPSFSLRSAGLLGTIFSGANPNGSTGAMNGQYFAFYDSYNNGSGSSSSVVPSKGNYGSYVSVVSSMSGNQFTTPYPGIYAGNFTVEFAASSGTTSTTYGAPYLRILSLPGALDSSNVTNFAVPPTSGTEYLYRYQYDLVPNATLANLKSTLNISGNVAGFMQLVSALDAGQLGGVSAFNPSDNEAAAAAITNQVFYGEPLNNLTQEPKGRFVYKLACDSDGADAASDAPTNALCQMFFTPGATNPDTYIDIYNGIVFQSKTTAAQKQLLYPIGFSISHDLRNGISQMIGGAVPVPGSTNSLTIKTPVITTTPSGKPVGQGSPLPGQVVKGKVVAAPPTVAPAGGASTSAVQSTAR
jgi:hypothetical protein